MIVECGVSGDAKGECPVALYTSPPRAYGPTNHHPIVDANDAAIRRYIPASSNSRQP